MLHLHYTWTIGREYEPDIAHPATVGCVMQVPLAMFRKVFHPLLEMKARLFVRHAKLTDPVPDTGQAIIEREGL